MSQSPGNTNSMCPLAEFSYLLEQIDGDEATIQIALLFVHQ
jgi:hypothetical protein